MKRFVLLVAVVALAHSFSLRAFLKDEITELEKDLGIVNNKEFTPEKCDQSANYAFSIDHIDVDPYPIQKGGSVNIAAIGTANVDLEIARCSAQIKAGILPINIDIDYTGSFKKGDPITVQKSYDVENIPFVTKVSLEVKCYNPNGDLLTCSKQSGVELKMTEEEEALMSSPSFSKCSSGATYEVEIQDMQFTPYPVKKDADLAVKVTGKSTSGDVVVNEFKISALGATVLDKKMTVDCASGATCEIDDTEKIPYIPFISHISAQADVYDNKGGHAACYNVKLAFA